MALPFFTIGHSTRTIPQFVDLLRAAGVEMVADIRTVPRSRTNPQYNKDVLGENLAPRGRAIAYGTLPPPLTPPRKGEGDLAAGPRRAKVGHFGQTGGVGVPLPLAGRGQGWGSAASKISYGRRPGGAGGHDAGRPLPAA